ncbi:MAG TPA: hypothetical protein VGF94_02895 [Kofleriaceae bacterium]|jgi:hypothetical protein
MRSLLIAGLLAGVTTVASADPYGNVTGRVAAVGGYDTSAPGNRDDGVSAALGYRYDRFSALGEYSWLDYDGTAGFGGGAQQVDGLFQAEVVRAHCDRRAEKCPHLDIDLGYGRRWVEWSTQQSLGYTPGMTQLGTIDHQGSVVELGLSASFGLHFSLHYVVFTPDPDTSLGTLCRGVCPMRVQGNAPGLMFEAGFAFGDT